MTASSQFLNGAFAAPELPEAVAWDSLQAAAAASGDTEAFRRLVERHSGALHRFCLHSLNCERDAEDVCQETLVRVWHSLPRCKDCGQFRAWLWKIGLNLCRDRLRSQKKRRCLTIAWSEQLDNVLVCPGQSPAEALHWRAEMQKLSRALDAMPEALRWPLTLCAIEGLSQAECAAALGISVRAAEGRIHRGRAWLLEWWQRHH